MEPAWELLIEETTRGAFLISTAREESSSPLSVSTRPYRSDDVSFDDGVVDL